VASLGTYDRQVTPSAVAVAALAMVLGAALWWTYFHDERESACRRMESLGLEQRARAARDAYSYVHLLMVGGIVFAALGIREALADSASPLPPVPAMAFCGGLALYLTGLNAFRFRLGRGVRVERTVAALALVAMIPTAAVEPSLATLAKAVMFLAALVAYQTLAPEAARGRAVGAAD
jgi:low temperature requirement protein LtrA